MPAIIPLMSLALFGTKVAGGQVIGFLVSLSGVAVIVLQGSLTSWEGWIT